MDKDKIKKEFCIYTRNGQGSPYIISSYSCFQDAFLALNSMVGIEQERGRFYYVDNDFYNNKYPPNMYGKYFCILERNVTEWENMKVYQQINQKIKTERL